MNLFYSSERPSTFHPPASVSQEAGITDLHFPDHELQAVLTLLSAASGVAGSCLPWDLVEMHPPPHLGFFLSLEVMCSSLELQFLGLRLTRLQNGSPYGIAEKTTEARAQIPTHSMCLQISKVFSSRGTMSCSCSTFLSIQGGMISECVC